MSVDYKTLFQLKDNFTKDQLKLAFLKKVDQINSNNNLSNIDKKFWLEQLNKMYIEGKNDLLHKQNNLLNPINIFDTNFNNKLFNFNDMYSNHINNINNMFSSFDKLDKNINSNNTGYYKSYKSVIGNDGVRYVQEINKTVNNDKVDSKINTYKIDKNGNKVYLDPKEIKQIM